MLKKISAWNLIFMHDDTNYYNIFKINYLNIVNNTLESDGEYSLIKVKNCSIINLLIINNTFHNYIFLKYYSEM